MPEQSGDAGGNANKDIISMHPNVKILFLYVPLKHKYGRMPIAHKTFAHLYITYYGQMSNVNGLG